MKGQHKFSILIDWKMINDPKPGFFTIDFNNPKGCYLGGGSEKKMRI